MSITIPARRRKKDPKITTMVDKIFTPVDTNPDNYEQFKLRSRLSSKDRKLLRDLNK